MIIDDLVESIKTELGFPVIDLYLTDDMIKILVKKAIRKCSDKASTLFTVEKQVVDGRVSLEGLGVMAIRNVYQSVNSSSFSGFASQIYGDSVGTLYASTQGGMFPGGSNDYLNIVARVGQLSELQRFIVADYYLDKEILYLDDYSGTVTIEYVKAEPELSEMDIEWQSWVESYALALCKISEGRIRSKFKPVNAPYEIESDVLVSEGVTDKQDLETKLDMAVGYWNILR